MLHVEQFAEVTSPLNFPIAIEQICLSFRSAARKSAHVHALALAVPSFFVIPEGNLLFALTRYTTQSPNCSTWNNLFYCQ